MQVLLVDDNAVNQLIGKAMLETLGAHVTVVSGGHAAVEAAARQAFDLVLMDLQMPDLDGIEATRRVREGERSSGRARTPVVAVTGQACSDVAAACSTAGIDEVLAKPYTREQLRRVVEAHALDATA
jgi:CheY-like chemotaxis protein